MKSMQTIMLACLLLLASHIVFSQNHVLVLDGSGDNLNLPETTSMASPTTAITMEALIYLESYQDGNIIASGNQNDYSFAVRTDKKLYAHLFGVSSSTVEFVGTNELALQVWHHVAFSYDGSHGRFYINGVLDAEISATGGISSSPQSEYYSIGSTYYNGAYNFFLRGKMDEIRLWNVARSQTQIKSNLCVPLASSDQTGLVGYWQFESGYADVSVNANYGLPLGNAAIIAEQIDVCSSPIWRRLITSNDPPGVGFSRSVYSLSAFDETLNCIMVIDQSTGKLYTLNLDTGVWSSTVTTNVPSWLNLQGALDLLHLDKSNNRLYLWHGGFYYTAYLNLNTFQWVTLTTTKLPDAFSSCLTYDNHRQRIVTFGGYGMWTYKNDLRYFNTTTNSWINYPKTGDVPPPDNFGSIMYDPSVDKIFLVGGHGNNNCNNAGIYSYDLQAQRWTKHLDPIPTKHNNYNSLVLKDGIFYYPGGTLHGCGFPTYPYAASYTNDVYSFSASNTSQFTRVPVSGIRPAPFHSLRVFADQTRNRLIVYAPKFNLHWEYPHSKEIWFLEWDSEPVADAGLDLSIECSSQTGTSVLLDGSGSSDPRNAQLTYEWSLGGSIIAGPSTNPASAVSLPVGIHTVTLKVTNTTNHWSTDDVVVTVSDNTAPTIATPVALTVATDPGLCSRSLSTLTLDPPAVSDMCSSTITLNHNAPANFPIGTTTVTWTAVDVYGNATTAAQTVTVLDQSSPQISVTINPTVLWPPNHRLVNISATVNAVDNCNVQYTLLSVTSNEPDNGLGDGDTSDDIQFVETGTADLTFKLRAERAGAGNGRVYTISYRAVDPSGNWSDATATVTVPHAMNKSGAEAASLSAALTMEQNHPNPFNPSTTIRYTLPADGYARLSVFDAIGRELTVLINEWQSVGEHSVTFDGAELNNGLYFYRLESNGQTIVRRMTVLK